MNLLVISADSLRLDFVSRTNPRIRTPRFDRRTRSFGFFERCFSVSSATRPVHTSLFTGLYPFEHGIAGQRSSAMRTGIPHLFDLFEARGYAAAGFSEAREVFEGLAYASSISSLEPDPERGRRQIRSFLERPGPRFLFLHYWSTHTPYGAPDQRASGQVGRLLAAGRIRAVQEQYARAVEKLFEEKIEPILEWIDLEAWCVFLFGDHGESWTPDEPYHGRSLRNSVLRVPFFFHIPRTGNPAPERPLLSLIDLFPTLAALFGLPVEYQGFGRDIRKPERAEWHLAEVDPIQGMDDLGREIRETFLLPGRAEPGFQWAIFDAEEKFTFDEKEGRGRLERTLEEEPLPHDRETEKRFRKIYEGMKARSRYASLPLPGADGEEAKLLEQRLRDLGYLS